jgi:hypothetical protein
MSRRSTSELAKNWPSSVFGRLNTESTNVENPLHLQGVFGDLDQPGSGRQPKHYESPALTAELWALLPIMVVLAFGPVTYETVGGRLQQGLICPFEIRKRQPADRGGLTRASRDGPTNRRRMRADIGSKIALNGAYEATHPGSR